MMMNNDADSSNDVNNSNDIDNDINDNTTLKTKGRQFDNFVITGGTVSCRNDNLQCHQ